MLYIYNIKVLDEGHTSVVRLPNKIVLSAGCYGFRISFYVFFFLNLLTKEIIRSAQCYNNNNMAWCDKYASTTLKCICIIYAGTMHTNAREWSHSVRVIYKLKS